MAMALLDLASSTTFVTERILQCLHLRHQYCHLQISSIGGLTTHSGSHEVVNFKVFPTTRHGKVIAMEAVVIPKISTDVPFKHNWKHLLNH